MKRFFYTAALAITVLAGCTKNEVNEIRDEKPVSFSTVVGNLQTKAVISGPSYETSNKFKSSAFMTNGDWDAAGAGLYIDNQEVSFDAAENCWSTATAYYWPQSTNLKLTFFSYHPSDVPATITAAEGVKIENWDVAENQNTDIMVADRVTAQSNTTVVNGWEAGVPTVFRHKLAQIVKFEIKADEEYYHSTRQVGDFEIIVKKISINGINTKGTYTSGNDVGTAADKLGEWTSPSEPESFVWYENGTGTILTTTAQEFKHAAADEDNYYLVLPQDFTTNDDATITIDYTLREYYKTDVTPNLYADTDKTATGKLNVIHTPAVKEFKMNTKISYTITMSVAQNQIYWAPSVEDWTTEDYSASIN